MNLD
jgi:hypothetical protein